MSSKDCMLSDLIEFKSEFLLGVECVIGLDWEDMLDVSNTWVGSFDCWGDFVIEVLSVIFESGFDVLDEVNKGIKVV